MKRIHYMLASTVAVAAIMVAASPVVSAFGQISGGNIYKVRNVTANGSYTDPANASCGNTIQFRVHIHNPGPDVLVNTRVNATLPSGTVSNFSSTVTVRADNSQPETTSDTASVNLSASASVAYLSGSTELLDINGNLVNNLPDGVTQSGVVLPSNVNVSGDNSRFVQFKAKISCPEVPKSKFECKALDVNQIDRTRFDFTARAHVENSVVQSYTFTVKNSSGATVDTQTVNTSSLSAVYRFNQSVAGNYVVSVIVKTDKGSTHASSICTKQITVKEQPTTPTTPPVVQGKTTELPNTGAGSLLGLFAGASALGSAAHYAVRRYIG